MTSDAMLLRQYVQRRDAGGFSELTTRYAALVYGTCLRVLGNAADAEDVAQECFLELARKAGAIHTSLPGWLHALAHSRAVDLVRRETTRRRYEQQAAIEQAEPSSWAELEPYVDDALAKLPDDLRQPILLHYLLGCTQAEAAARLGTTQATVSRRLEKGIEALRAHLRKAGVIASVALLTVLLSQHAATAAPAALTAALGKMAVSGVGSATAVPGLALAGKFAAGLAVVAVLLGGSIYLFQRVASSRMLQESAALAAVNWQASLPDGTQVVMAGVTRSPMTTRQWWTPNGAPLLQDPLQNVSVGIGHPKSLDNQHCWLVFQLSGKPQQYGVSRNARWRMGKSLESCSIGGDANNIVLDLMQQPGQPFDRTATVFLGLADSPWQIRQITRCNSGVFTNTRAADALHAFTVQEIYITRQVDGKSCCEAAVVYPRALIEQEAIRMTIFDAHGQQYYSSGSSTHLTNMATVRFDFLGITPEQIAKVQFETRPYTWLKFTDVALEPTAQ